MASQLKTVSEILQLAKISEYLSFNDRSNKNFLKGGTVDYRLPLMISCEWKSVQWQYDLDPTNIALRGAANYLYDILGIYALKAQAILDNLSGTAPLVSGPSNQNVNVGDSATFTITVTSSSSYSIAWYRNSILIPGETGLSYTLNSAQLSDSGAVFSAIVTNSSGSTSSDNATLTVTQTITGSFFFGDVDYYSELSVGIDNINYNGTFSITNGQPLVVNFTSGAQNNKFNGIRYPLSQGTKTQWENVPLNAGAIPDSVMRSTITIGSYLYVISRVAMSLDSTNQTITYS